jgi:uncharacterized membrane protein
LVVGVRDADRVSRLQIVDGRLAMRVDGPFRPATVGCVAVVDATG